MSTFIYRCPITGQKVQGWVADAAAGDDTYNAVTCSSCNLLHFVNVTTGKVLRTADENDDNLS
ncbi:MAG TPA: hypothetical protein VMU69_03945 [Bradyrhizobium sp.]|nr:hypothetical protein [Bradyrhizobium sp.]